VLPAGRGVRGAAGSVTGIEPISASIGEFRRAFPAAEVAFGVPDHHGEFARVSWVTRWHDGRADLAGEDFAQFGADGRIGLLVSFDGSAGGYYPAAPAPTLTAPRRGLSLRAAGTCPGLGLTRLGFSSCRDNGAAPPATCAAASRYADRPKNRPATPLPDPVRQR